MKILISTLCIFFAAIQLLPVNAEAASGSPALAVIQAESEQSADGMTRPDQSPLEELDPRQASWKTWLGPIVIGIFAFFLVFMIRRFSRAEANRDVDPPDPD